MQPQLANLSLANKAIFINGEKPTDLFNIIDAIYSVSFDRYTDQMGNFLRYEKRRKLNPSEIAISLSFYKMTHIFYESNENVCIFCEDDIIFLTSDIVKDFNEYLANSVLYGLIQAKTIFTEPCIFYGCYIERLHLQAKTKLSTQRIFRLSQPSYGNPLYIINRKFAELILKDFFPIKYAFDDYLRNLVVLYGIKCFKASPMLAYELSSDYYKAFYKPDDIIHKKNLVRQSQILKEMPSTIAVSSSFCSTLTRCLLRGTGLRIVTANQGERYLVMMEDLEKVISENAIICGSGINDPSLFRGKRNPFLILSVRGPLTHNFLTEKGILYSGGPLKFGDPLLAISYIIKPGNTRTKPGEINIGIICKKKEYNIITKLLKSILSNESTNMATNKATNTVTNRSIGMNRSTGTNNSTNKSPGKSTGKTTGKSPDTNMNIKINYIFIDIASKLELIVAKVCQVEYLFSTLLQGIILGHTYNKKTVWITLLEMTENQMFRFIDYYEGIKMILSNFSKTLKYESPVNLIDLDNQIRKTLSLDISLPLAPRLFLDSIVSKCFNPGIKEVEILKATVLQNNPILGYIGS